MHIHTSGQWSCVLKERAMKGCLTKLNHNFGRYQQERPPPPLASGAVPVVPVRVEEYERHSLYCRVLRFAYYECNSGPATQCCSVCCSACCSVLQCVASLYTTNTTLGGLLGHAPVTLGA